MSKWDSDTAEWYAKKYGEYDTNRLGVEALTIPANSVVVDIGCGTGCALRHASKQVTTGSLIGIDPVPRMIQIAQEQTAAHPAADRITYCEGAAESLPIEDSIADYVLAFDSIDHWQDRLQGLKEVTRILKQDGYLAVVKDGGLPSSAVEKNAFYESLEKAGFKVLKEQTIKEADISFTIWICALTS